MRSRPFNGPRHGLAIRVILVLTLLIAPVIDLRSAESEQTKLAILTAGESGELLGEILTAELANTPGVAVLERSAIGKAVQEQTKAAQSSSSVVGSGRLLGADGLLVLDSRRLNDAYWVSLRLMGVRQGVSVGWWEYAVPKTRTLEWSKGASAELEQLLPKLAGETNASAIAFVGFTSPSSSKAGVTLERELNALLLSRLSAEPGLLVLERRKLLEASFENALSREDSQFWNSAYMVEGSINSERIRDEEIQIKARLAPRGHGAPIEFVAKGWGTNLAALASQCVAEIRRGLKLRPSSLTWTPEAEAERFYQHARNAVRWGFWSEAAAAADSAIALGKNDLDTKCLRLSAYTGRFKIDERETMWRSYKPRFGEF